MHYRQYVKGDIPASEIQSCYSRTFGVSFWQRLFRNPFQIADEYYLKVDEGLIKQVLEQDKIDLIEYQDTIFDCDDFAFGLMGAFHQNTKAAAMPIFITWVAMPQCGHAVLSYYLNDCIQIIEPQTDEIFDVPKNWRLMLICG